MAENSVAAKFEGLPMSDLIAGPFFGVCDSQLNLAQASYEYMMKIGFKEDGTTRLIEFDLNRPAETPGGYDNVQTHVQAPFLGLVSIPSLLVEETTVEF